MAGRFFHLISVRYIHWALQTLVLLQASTCVSVHWDDGRGLNHHWGSLWYSISKTESAEVFEVNTLGLDRRLYSADPRLGIGFRKYILAKPLEKTQSQTTI